MDSKKQSNVIVRIFILFIQILLYIPIQIVFIPFVIIGFIHALYKEMIMSKKLDISFTAVQALQYRWIMHYFETREDSLSIRFIKKFPCESHFGLMSTFGALIISQKLFGLPTKFKQLAALGDENLISTPGRRLVMFDDIMKKYVDKVDQIVMPGSGFDMMTLNYTKDKNVKVYELDQVNTLRVKVETLEKAKINHDWVTYIPVDFSKELWSDKLLEAGFDKTKKTLFIWQSVSLYLEDKDVKDTVSMMADLCVEGSIVAQDFYSKRLASGEISKTVNQTAKMMGKFGEPWKFGIDMLENPNESVEKYLADCGLKMTNIHQFGNQIGEEPFYCIVEAIKL